MFSAENLTWIIGNWPGTTTEIFASEPAKASGEVCLERSRTDYSGMFFSPGRPCSREAFIAEGLAPDVRRIRGPPSRSKLLQALQQDEDPTTKAWLQQAQAGDVPTTGGVLQLTPEGLLQFRAIKAPSEPRLFVPKVWRRDVIFYTHRQKNHARKARLTTFLSLRFWWPTMEKDVGDTLLDCHFCLVARARRLMRHTEYTSMKVEGPHQGFGLDVWGPTVKAPTGHRYILTLVDLFHGYVRYFPMRTKSSAEIISVAMNLCWWHVGLPKFVLTDFDAAFRSTLCKEFCRAARIEVWHTAPYSAWELGRVERRHQDLNVAMKALVDKESWPDHLPGPVAYASNTLKSTVTKVCPSEVEYGYVPRGPLDLLMMTPAAPELPSPAAPKADLIGNHVAALRDAQRVYTRLAKHHAEKSREAGVRRKNQQAASGPARKKLKVGDRVAVERPRKAPGLPRKAVLQWRGPYTITAITRRGYRCEYTDGSSVTVSRPYLAPYTARRDPRQIALADRAQPVLLSAYQPGELLAIGDHLPDEEGSRRYQLAKFVGFSDGDPAWLRLAYLGTTTARPPYRFQPVWIDHGDGKAMLQVRRPRPGRGVSADVRRWTGVDPASHVLKLDVPLRLTSAGALTRATLAALGQWKPRVMGR